MTDNARAEMFWVPATAAGFLPSLFCFSLQVSHIAADLLAPHSRPEANRPFPFSQTLG